MLYLVAEFSVLFVIAALLGILLGWVLRGRSAAKRLESKWRSAYEHERAAAERLGNESGACHSRVQALEEQIETLTKTLQTLEQEKQSQNIASGDGEALLKTVQEIARRTAGDMVELPDDDLKTIKGIGPKLEALLKQLGITSYRQIANFQDSDIQYVAAAIRSFPDRITRDNWMDGATREHEKKYGEAP